MILERQVLQGQQEDRQPGPLPGFRELLQQVGVTVGAVAGRFEVLAELVEDQQERSVRGQAAGDGDERRGRGAGSARVVGGRVVERCSQGVCCGEVLPRGVSVGAAHRRMECAQHRVAQRLTACGD